MRRYGSNRILSMLQVFYWSAYCILFSFLVPLYRHYGYSNATIGILSMINSFATLAVQPLWGILGDRTGKPKPIFLATIAVSVPLAIGLRLGNGSAWWIGLIAFLLTCTYQSMGAVLDSWIMRLADDEKSIRYSLTRGFGSFAFALTAVGFGLLLDAAGMNAIPLAFTAVVLLLLAAAFLTRSPGIAHRTAGSPFASFSSLLGDRRFRRLLVALTLLYTGNGAVMVFMPVRMAALGGTNASLGLALTVMAMSEVPTMLFHHRIVALVRNRHLLSVALFFYFVRALATALVPDAGSLILVQLIQSLSFGLFLPSIMLHIARTVDKKSLVTTLLLFNSATYGLGVMSGSLLGGFLAELVGVQAMLLLLSCLTFGVFLLSVTTDTFDSSDVPGPAD